MYSVDGLALQNPGFGWIFRGPSKPLSDLTVRRSGLQLPGLPGVVAGLDDPLASLDPPTPTLVVQTPRRYYPDLLALLTDGQVLSLTGQTDREAAYELLSTSHQGYGNADEIVDVTATIRIPGVFWRDTTEKTYQASLNSATVALDLWDMTGLVTDAIVRVTGPVTGLQLKSRWASVYYSAIPSGSRLRYHSDTGRAYVTTTDTWTGGTEVSGQVIADGPGDKFGIFPSVVSPVERVGRVSVTTATRGAGALIQVRGKGAHLA